MDEQLVMESSRWGWSSFFWAAIFLNVIFNVIRSIRIVPTQQNLVVERLGNYSKTLGPGFHLLVPYIDRVTADLDMREQSFEVPPQECFSKDEVQVEVDAIMYIAVVDAFKAAYGVVDYRFAATQLAQTTTRSVVGKLDLDHLFEERDMISAKVVETINRAGELWGIRILRYEIKNIVPPKTVQGAMEKQVNAERERRALIAKSEGDKQSRINRSEGLKAEMINLSEGEMLRLVNEAEGEAAEILQVAKATAEAITKVGASIVTQGGAAAVKLEIAQKYLDSLAYAARSDSQLIMPTDLSSLDQVLKQMDLELKT
jgi:regulator of protease activity HflC (stomatin/prohibitin superfamily)